VCVSVCVCVGAGQDGATGRWDGAHVTSTIYPSRPVTKGRTTWLVKKRQEVENGMRYRTNECSEKSESPSRKVGLLPPSRDYECAGGR
jgi:hypothetical protein